MVARVPTPVDKGENEKQEISWFALSSKNSLCSMFAF